MEDNRKNWEVTLRLSAEDYKDLVYKAGICGLTEGELLEVFVADLIGSGQSTGSDERMYIDDWFRRCRYSQFWDQAQTYLHYLLLEGTEAVEDALEDWENLEEIKDDLEDVRSGRWRPRDGIEGLQNEYEDAKNRIYERYQEYAAYLSKFWDQKEYTPDEFAKELREVREWHKRMEEI